MSARVQRAGTEAGLLPMAPAPVDAVQAALTAAQLGDADALYGYFAELRRAVDPALAARFPEFAGKPYPLGRCREIRDAVVELLQERAGAPRPGVETAIASFIRGGGIARKIWGVLRDTYFQNAIQLGAWYVDVANDTVVAAKPPVEILAIAEVDMVALRDFRHFAEIAGRYWKAEVYRNSVFPRLAAFFPLIVVYPDGIAEPGVGSDQLTELTRRAAFRPSLEALAAFVDPPPEVAARLARRAGDEPLLQTSGDPLRCTEEHAALGRHHDLDFRRQCVAAFRRVSAGSPRA